MLATKLNSNNPVHGNIKLKRKWTAGRQYCCYGYKYTPGQHAKEAIVLFSLVL